MTIQSPQPNGMASNQAIALWMQSWPFVGWSERGPSAHFIASTGAAFVLALALSIFSGALPASAAPAPFKTAGDWDVQITVPDASGTAVSTVAQVSQPDWVTVTAEKYDSLPVFSPR